MAVVDAYVDSDIAAGNEHIVPALEAGGAETKILWQTFEIAAADDDGSKYRVFKDLPPGLIPIRIDIACDAITAGTVFDVGLYSPDLGAVIDADCFAANLDLSSASRYAVDGLGAVAIENFNKRIFEHAGHTAATKLRSYDLVITGDTVGTAAGTVCVRMTCLQG